MINASYEEICFFVGNKKQQHKIAHKY